MHLTLSTTALRQIRKYGGFDNYILLSPPNKLDSIYGEYLRKAMLFKLKDPNQRIPYILRSHPLNKTYSVP